MKLLPYSVVYLLGLISFSEVLAAEQADVLEEVEVTSSTPLSSDTVSIDKIPTPVQTVTAAELQKSQSLSLADYINQHLGSVHINEAQSSTLQPDVYYRGFVASPLLGMPQGLSVYVNGVRFNEAFGDTVNWDLIPERAIDTMTLHSGSNPLYGLNTLGGALALKTKTGFSAPKHQLEVYGGSWDRQSEELTSGWNNGEFGYFIDLHNFGEQGWRDHSRSSAKQVFSTLSWRGDKGSLDLSLAANDNSLKGNGPAPIQLFEQEPKNVFTYPDRTITRMFFSELAGDYDLTDDITLSSNVYFRQNRIGTFNGDDSDYAACGGMPGFMCVEEENGEALITDVNGNTITASPTLEGASNNTSQTNMRSRGGTIQAAFNQDLFQFKNKFILGTSYDNADTHFESDTELAQLMPDRGTLGSGILLEESRVRLNTENETYSFFFTDSFSITDALTLTFGGRYNYTDIRMENRYQNGPDKLSGTHGFDRFNPAVGLTYQIAEPLTWYGSYSESARVPTPMELSCADENDPCRLPNAFLADPPLKQVVAHTWETGVRGYLDSFLPKGEWQWNLGFFHTLNQDDIIFNRGGDSISEGFFSNVGETRRYGIEAGTHISYPELFSQIDDWDFSANYTYLNARFLDGFVTQNPLDNSRAAIVSSGDRIPGIPEHLFKATLSVDLWHKWSIGLNGLYSGDQFFRGDEANNTAQLAGYWLFNLTTEVKVTDNFSMFGSLNNLFGADYKTFGVYGDATEVLGPAYYDGRFVSPGAPRAGWLGIRLEI